MSIYCPLNMCKCNSYTSFNICINNNMPQLVVHIFSFIHIKQHFINQQAFHIIIHKSYESNTHEHIIITLIANKSHTGCCRSDSKLDFWKCKIGARIWKSSCRILAWLWSIFLRVFSAPECCNSAADVSWQHKIDSYFYGLDLFQFFYDKYRPCIRVNLEIEGVETKV